MKHLFFLDFSFEEFRWVWIVLYVLIAVFLYCKARKSWNAPNPSVLQDDKNI